MDNNHPYSDEDALDMSDSEHLGRPHNEDYAHDPAAQDELTDEHEFHRRNLDDEDYGIEVDEEGDDNDADDLEAHEEDDEIISGFRSQKTSHKALPTAPMDEEEEPVAEEPQRESRTRPKTARAANPQPMSSSASPEELDTIMDPSQFSDPSLAKELQDLFRHIKRYQPLEIELETELKPFVPDFLPAIGDIDAFIKIDRPDEVNDRLGLIVLDEPATHQSDPSVLDLHLRAVTKASSATPRAVRSLESDPLRKDPKALDAWLKNVKELHTKKPPASVHYTKRMPDIEELMQVWPEPVEAALKTLKLPSPDIDLPLAMYSQILALILDIPVSPPQERTDHQGRKSTTRNVIEGLHVLFTLYSEFKNSAHFNALDRDEEVAPSNTQEMIV